MADGVHLAVGAADRVLPVLAAVSTAWQLVILFNVGLESFAEQQEERGGEQQEQQQQPDRPNVMATLMANAARRVGRAHLPQPVEGIDGESQLLNKVG